MTAYDDLAAEIAGLAAGRRPVLVGISGAVGVGKSTTAELLRERLAARHATTEVVATDGFLLPNDELDRRGLTMRKGFPESFDDALLVELVDALRTGRTPVEVPVYSHEIYDRLAERRVIDDADVVILEGVNALQPPVVDELDMAVYLDASESDLGDWFTDRFLRLCDEAEPGTFYEGFGGLDVEQRRTMAASVWTGVNLVNLHDHIGPSRARATHVLAKNADHSVREVVSLRARP